MSRPRNRRRASRGALAIIGCLLALSAVLRLGGDAGKAWARVSETPADSLAAAAPECTGEDELHAMLKSFQDREAKLQIQEAEMAGRQSALEAADARLDAKLAELRAAEEELRRTLTIADTAADGDVERLTKVYETMKPKQAAALFEEMDPAFAAGFLGRMKPEAAAGILAGLSPEAAHMFSVVLAGRNAGAPRE
ncbi:MotE family protein [Roseovarius aquimarinus]|uniref:MotE family protein n=1 Tax=Roseovarius aquimarinus TaxID=1229156 RepID=A0ABW7IB51_9RHOB